VVELGSRSHQSDVVSLLIIWLFWVCDICGFAMGLWVAVLGFGLPWLSVAVMSLPWLVVFVGFLIGCVDPLGVIGCVDCKEKNIYNNNNNK
jgi:hypothetical protein